MRSSRSEPNSFDVRSKGHLLRILGVGFGVAVIVGNTIGSGILLTPGDVAKWLKNGPLILAVWTMGGIFAFFCTQAVTELGTALPLEGGWLVYSRRAFGEYAGFLVGCCDWMMQAASMAYLAAAFGEFASDFDPALRGHEHGAAIACLIALTVTNWIGLPAGSRTQKITSLLKSLALVAFVVACFTHRPRVFPGHVAAPARLLQLPAGALLLAIVAALQPVIVTYDGWYGAIYFAEEDKEPAKNLPRSSLLGVLACAAIFLLVNAALLHVFSASGLAVSQMPVADAAELIFGGRGRSAILLVSVVTVVSTINATLLISPRILFAMARDGLMPGWVASVNSGGTPSGALLLSATAAIALVLSGGFETLVAMASILFVAVYLSGFLALFVLRVREPGLKRPFKMWGYPWTSLSIGLGTAAFLIAAVVADLRHALFTVVLVVLTYPLYISIKRMRAIRKAAPTEALLVSENPEE